VEEGGTIRSPEWRGALLGWLPFLAWAAFSHWLLATPSPPALLAPRLPFVGNAGHAVLGAGIALASLIGLPYSGLSGRGAFLGAFAIAFAWALVEEWVQASIPGRSSSVWDASTGALGGALALSAAWAWSVRGRLSWREALLALLALGSAAAATLHDRASGHGAPGGGGP